MSSFGLKRHARDPLKIFSKKQEKLTLSPSSLGSPLTLNSPSLLLPNPSPSFSTLTDELTSVLVLESLSSALVPSVFSPVPSPERADAPPSLPSTLNRANSTLPLNKAGQQTLSACLKAPELAVRRLWRLLVSSGML